MTPAVRVTVNGQPFRDVPMTRQIAQCYVADSEPPLPDDWQPTALTIAWLIEAQHMARRCGIATDTATCAYHMTPEAMMQVEGALIGRMEGTEVVATFRGFRVYCTREVPFCDFDVMADGEVAL